MENRFYLLSLGVSGIKCIKDEVRLQFYKKTVDKNFDPNKYRIKSIYGENGSGKTAIVTAVKILQDLVLYTNYFRESKNQDYLNEMVNKVTGQLKIDIEYLDMHEDVMQIYDYSVVVGKNVDGRYEITEEKLQKKSGAYPNAKYNTVFECQKGEIVSLNLYEEESDMLVKKTLNLLSNQSVVLSSISILFGADEVEKKGDKSIPFLYDCSILISFIIGIRIYLSEEDQHELYFLKNRYAHNEISADEVGRKILKINEANLMLPSLNSKEVYKPYYEIYEKQVEKLCSFIQIFKTDLTSIEIDKKDAGDYYICDLILNYGNYTIDKEFESTGIRKLIRLFDLFNVAADQGIAFIDEMDANLNDVYLCRLIEYFKDYGKGQLIFTTHNLDPMRVLEGNKNAIDFLSSDNHLVNWTTHGNSNADDMYRRGMIEYSPFNIFATDFIGVLGD